MTPDANGILYLEETDPITPFQTTINALQAATSEAINDVYDRTVLPDPKIVAGPSTAQIVATEWDIVPGWAAQTFTVPREMWIQFSLGAWCSQSTSTDLRAGIQVSGAITSVPNNPAWASVAWSSNASGATMGANVRATKTLKVPAGSLTVSPVAYRGGTGGAVGFNYSLLEIIPLRWAS